MNITITVMAIKLTSTSSTSATLSSSSSRLPTTPADFSTVPNLSTIFSAPTPNTETSAPMTTLPPTCPSDSKIEELFDRFKSERAALDKEFLETFENIGIQQLVDQITKVNSDLYNQLTNGISSECQSMRKYVTLHETQPTPSDLAFEITKLKTMFEDYRREFGKTSGKILNMVSDSIRSFQDDFDQTNARLDKLTNLIEGSLKYSKIHVGSTTCDFSKIESMLGNVLTVEELHSFFSFENCSRNKIACLPWLIAIPAIVGLIGGLIFAVKCYCCAVRQNRAPRTVSIPMQRLPHLGNANIGNDNVNDGNVDNANAEAGVEL